MAAGLLMAGAPGGLMAQEDASPGQLLKGAHEAEGVERSYRLVLPDAAPDDGRALVVMLHGCTQKAEDFATGTRMDRYALAQGFLVLYPEQPARLHPQRCWRWYEEANQRRDSGGAAQLVAMIRAVVEEHSVDPDRIYVAGMSAGGAMALVLAATHPALFAAAASHSGVAYGAARSQAEALAAMGGKGPDARTLARRLSESLERAGAGAPPPLLVIHGDQDGAVDPSNAGAIVRAWLQAGAPDVEAPLPDRRLPPRSPSTGVGEPAVSTEVWERDGGEVVRLVTVPGLGHAWSGGDPAGSYTADGPSATERVLSFFARVTGDASLRPERSGTEGVAGAEPGGDVGAAGGGGP